MQYSSLLPALGLLVWTVLVWLDIPLRQLRPHVDSDDFRFSDNDEVPPELTINKRNFINLLEIPQLFYMLSLTVFVTHSYWLWFAPIAWVYVLLRILHSLIHLTYNKALHRHMAFSISNLVLVTLCIGTYLSVLANTELDYFWQAITGSNL